jgi:putative ABC transport system substrate-binding protein
MRRREFLGVLAGAAVVWPLAARAQQSGGMRRVGFLSGGSEKDAQWQAQFAAFNEGLRLLGWAPDRNIQIEVRWAGANLDRLRAYAAELVTWHPDAIVAAATFSLTALQRATTTIPIVFAQVSDPVRGGFVTSLARPGGNITGFALYEYAIAAKWLELLKQLTPHLSRLGVLYDPALMSNTAQLSEIRDVAAVERIHAFAVRNASEIEQILENFAREPNGGLIVLPSAVTAEHRVPLIASAAKHRIPAVYAYRPYVADGGLASYGVDLRDAYRRTASYVDRILKGEKPGELPVQHSTKFELVINLKTAKSLGLDPPLSLLARTDEVIE